MTLTWPWPFRLQLNIFLPLLSALSVSRLLIRSFSEFTSCTCRRRRLQSRPIKCPLSFSAAWNNLIIRKSEIDQGTIGSNVWRNGRGNPKNDTKEGSHFTEIPSITLLVTRRTTDDILGDCKFDPNIELVDLQIDPGRIRLTTIGWSHCKSL